MRTQPSVPEAFPSELTSRRSSSKDEYFPRFHVNITVFWAMVLSESETTKGSGRYRSFFTSGR